MENIELIITELRIGNWIFEPEQDDNKPFQIFSIYHEVKNDKVNGLPICLMRPIPLTEDILLKCGFQKDMLDETYYTINPNEYHIRIEDSEIKPREKVFWVYFDEQPNHPITCVFNLHQLQNLYFALTGEELTINL